MARSTATRRTPPPRPKTETTEPERLDLGHLVLPKGTLVEGTTLGGRVVVGTLLSVDYKNGVAHNVGLWVTEHRRHGDRRGTRFVPAATVKEVS